VGSKGTSPLGDHFMNGAAIAGFTDSGSTVTIYTKSGADADGRTVPTNFSY
jgi:hypothetical protein